MKSYLAIINSLILIIVTITAIDTHLAINRRDSGQKFIIEQVDHLSNIRMDDRFRGADALREFGETNRKIGDINGRLDVLKFMIEKK